MGDERNKLGGSSYVLDRRGGHRSVELIDEDDTTVPPTDVSLVGNRPRLVAWSLASEHVRFLTSNIGMSLDGETLKVRETANQLRSWGIIKINPSNGFVTLTTFGSEVLREL